MVMAGYDDDDVIGTDVTEIFRSQRLWTVPANDVCALVPREAQLWKLMTICSAGVALGLMADSNLNPGTKCGSPKFPWRRGIGESLAALLELRARR